MKSQLKRSQITDEQITGSRHTQSLQRRLDDLTRAHRQVLHRMSSLKTENQEAKSTFISHYSIFPWTPHFFVCLFEILSVVHFDAIHKEGKREKI